MQEKYGMKMSDIAEKERELDGALLYNEAQLKLAKRDARKMKGAQCLLQQDSKQKLTLSEEKIRKSRENGPLAWTSVIRR